MTVEQNEALVRRLIAEVFNGHDLDGLDALLAPDLVSNWQGAPPLRGITAWREGMEGFFAAYPDAVYTLDDLFCTEDRGAWRGHWRATQRGDWQGVAASGREVAWDVIIVGRLRRRHAGRRLGRLRPAKPLPATWCVAVARLTRCRRWVQACRPLARGESAARRPSCRGPPPGVLASGSTRPPQSAA